RRAARSRRSTRPAAPGPSPRSPSPTPPCASSPKTGGGGSGDSLPSWGGTDRELPNLLSLRSSVKGGTSVPKHPHAGEHHRQAARVGGFDDLLVAHRTARLDHRRAAGVGRLDQAVGEREEGFRGAGGALEVQAEVGRAQGGDAGGILA